MDQFLLKGIKTCFITRGVPGSGKTTFAFNLKKQLELGGFTVEIAAADDYFPDGFKAENLGFAHTSCTKKLVSAMQNGIDAVIQHNTNVKEWESQALRSIVIQILTINDVECNRLNHWAIWCIMLK